jgi:predicted metalloprotease with PDZ domain
MIKLVIKLLSLLFLCLSANMGFAQQPSTKAFYRYSVDLNHAPSDQLEIELSMDGLPTQEAVFCLPAMVPGIYGQLDYGRNMIRIEAFNKSGKALAVTQIDTNCWKISNAKALRKLRYTVKDEWDDFARYEQLSYRSPGSMFSENEVFLINNNCIFGYFKGFDRQSMQITVQKPASFYAATSLSKTSEKTTSVQFQAADYHELVDNPVLFAAPDTAQIMLGDVPVLVACYSTGKTPVAKNIAAYITPLLQNQKAYLGGTLPVKRYTFIIYLHTTNDPHNSFGDGLEHAQSTVILNNMIFNPEALSRSVYSIASHEFFHTIMPLALHSEEIEYYDFQKPIMSQHLWLYEGMTEYYTIHMPIRQGLETLDQFCAQIGEKINTMEQFEYNLPLTELSKQAVSRQDQYMNVYNRGALVCLCLDIRLREFSGGKYGVQDLIHNLLKQYGKNKPFKDSDLFAEITRISGDESLSDFFQKYVAGPEPPPIKEYLNKVGLTIGSKNKVQAASAATESQLALRKQWIGL